MCDEDKSTSVEKTKRRLKLTERRKERMREIKEQKRM